MNEKQEIHCHACGQWVQFSIDKSLNGNHVLACPNCAHSHCRVVKDGEITDIRWDRRNGPTIQVQYLTCTLNPIYTATTTSSSYTATCIAISWASGYYTSYTS